MTATFVETQIVALEGYERYPKPSEPLSIGQPVEFRREWNHWWNPSAVSVWICLPSGQGFVGYLAGKVATAVADELEQGHLPLGQILGVTYTPTPPNCLIKIQIHLMETD
jgi:hypothetical protein